MREGTFLFHFMLYIVHFGQHIIWTIIKKNENKIPKIVVNSVEHI